MKLNKFQKQAIVTAIMHDVPKVVINQDDIQAAVAKAMSPAVRKIFKSNPKALASRHVGGYEFETPGYGWTLYVGDAQKVDDLLKPFKQKKEEREAAERRVRSIVNGCNTLKQLQTLLPEFKKYFPTEEKPTANLPVVANLSADLIKLGWKAATK